MVSLTSVEKELIQKAELLKTEPIVDEILKTAQFSWKISMDSGNIDEWLSNFCGDALGSARAERNLALWMLSSFVFFSIDDVRSFCEFLFTEFIHTKLVEYQKNGLLQDLTIEEKVAHILSSTVFLALGNDSESGSNVLYYFRQVNKLKREVFEKRLDEEYENLVIIDDVSISGAQALSYIPQMQAAIKHMNTYYLTFLASRDAVDELRHIHVETICANIISDREKCFTPDSYVFSTEKKKRFLPLAAKMCEYYGDRITKGHPEADGYPLGFDQAQSLFCFFYNTPDNTLPIFWCSGAGWKPLFTRYEKLFNNEEVPITRAVFV